MTAVMYDPGVSCGMVVAIVTAVACGHEELQYPYYMWNVDGAAAGGRFQRDVPLHRPVRDEELRPYEAGGQRPHWLPSRRGTLYEDHLLGLPRRGARRGRSGPLERGRLLGRNLGAVPP